MTPANPAATPIATSKTAALAWVLDSVPKGYCYYTSGQCPAEKAEQLAQKFHERYGIGCSPAQRITRKKKGLANALLVMYWPGFQASRETPDELFTETPPEAPHQVSATATQVSWLLLVTEGDGMVREQENLDSLIDGKRLVWLGYELVRLPGRGKATWTWRRTKTEMADLYALLGEQLAHRQMPAVSQTLLRVSRQPGFSGVRQQSWALCQFARSKGYSAELPFLFHVQKLPHGVPLALSSSPAGCPHRSK